MVEVNRRTGLGAILGGLFAGPDVAKQAGGFISKGYETLNQVEKVKDYPGEFQSSYPPTPMEIAQKEDYQVEHMRSRIKEIKSIISGDYFKTEQYRYENDDWSGCIGKESINSLKSVSASYKEIMEREYNFKISREHQQKRAKLELQEYYTNWAKNKLWGKVSDLFE